MVSASLVKELREKTGAGMMDCKKVLTETDGDMDKAAELEDKIQKLTDKYVAEIDKLTENKEKEIMSI